MLKSSTLLCLLGLTISSVSAQHGFLQRPASAQAFAQQFSQPHQAGHPAAARGTASTIMVPGQMVSYVYDETANAWVNPGKHTFTFNPTGKQTQETVSDSTSGTPHSRFSTTYNANDRLVEEVTEAYISGAWQNTTRQLITYDARQQKTQEEFQYALPNGGWQTEEGTQYVNEYNTANHLTTQTVRGYKASTRTYTDSLRFIYTVPANGEWTARIEQRMDDNGTWSNFERQQNVVWHDFAKDQMASAEAQEWTGSAWQTVSRMQGTYSATLEEVVVQELENNAWVNYERQITRYDAQGNLTSAKYEEWTGSSWEVSIAEFAIQLYYNPDNSVRRRITSFAFFGVPLAPMQLDNFSNYQSVVLSSRPRQLPALAVQTYPNPSADGRFTLLLPATSAAQVQVLDAVGRQVATDSWTGATRTSYPLNLSGQKAGIYTVKISTAAGTAVQKLIVR